MKTTLSQFFAKIYGWTFLGLVISGVTAMWIQSVPSIQAKVSMYPWVTIILVVLELLLVAFFTKRLKKASPSIINILYFVYAAFTGATISAIFIYFDAGVISTSFFIVAVMFLLMAVIGSFTKAELAQASGIFMMGIIGVIISIIVNMFIQVTQLDYILSIIAVIIFTLLTGYSKQKLEASYKSVEDSKKDMSVMALIGASELYLDLINMFVLPICRVFEKIKR